MRQSHVANPYVSMKNGASALKPNEESIPSDFSCPFDDLRLSLPKKRPTYDHSASSLQVSLGLSLTSETALRGGGDRCGSMCLNGGTCDEETGKCACRNGYAGEYCQVSHQNLKDLH